MTLSLKTTRRVLALICLGIPLSNPGIAVAQEGTCGVYKFPEDGGCFDARFRPNEKTWAERLLANVGAWKQ